MGEPMSILRKLNPFRRKCCAVPLVAGSYDRVGNVVTGIAEIDGAVINWVGIVQDPSRCIPVIDEALDVAERVLIDRMKEYRR